MKIKITFILFCLVGVFLFGSKKTEIIKVEKIAESKSFFDLGIRYVSKMAIDSRDNLFIIDSVKNKIFKLGIDLKLISSFGKKGQGPGEFNSVRNISIDEKDNVFIIDAFNKIIKYANSGELIKEEKIPSNVMTSSGYLLKYPIFIASKYRNMKHYNILIDVEKNKVLKKFELLCSPNYAMSTGSGGMIAIALEFVGGHQFIDTLKDKCVIAEGERVFVRLIDSTGKVRVIKKSKPQKLKLSSKEISYLSNKFYNAFGGRFTKPNLIKLLSNYEYKNSIYNVKISKDKIYIFLVPKDVSIPDRYPVEIYSFDGNLIRKAFFPFVPDKIFRDIAIKVKDFEEEGEDIKKIVKYRIK